MAQKLPTEDENKSKDVLLFPVKLKPKEEDLKVPGSSSGISRAADVLGRLSEGLSGMQTHAPAAPSSPKTYGNTTAEELSAELSASEVASGAAPKMPSGSEILATPGKSGDKARKDVIKGIQKESGAKLSPDQEATVMELLRKGKVPSESSGIHEGFTQALLGFLPLIGGAIFGGSEGAAIGGAYGLEAIKMRQGQLSEETKLAQEANLKKADLEAAYGRAVVGEEGAFARHESQQIFDANQKRLDREMEFAKAKMTSTGSLDTKDLFNITGDIRKQFMADHSGDLTQIRLDRELSELAANPGIGANKQTLVYKFMKQLDKNSAILNEERKSLESRVEEWWKVNKNNDGFVNSVSFPAFKSWMESGGRANFPPAVIQDMLNTSRTLTVPAREAVSSRLLSDFSKLESKGISSNYLFNEEEAAFHLGIPLGKKKEETSKSRFEEFRSRIGAPPLK